ncbi:MAG: ATPase domain-containing protein, partial [Microcystaceae cyanobacterium]
SCGTYGTLQEEVINTPTASANPRQVVSQRRSKKESHPAQPHNALRFSQIAEEDQGRLPSGYRELDRVLGGGIVPGALILIGGDPGIGKSTLLLQVAFQLAKTLPRILYVSAEESAQQIKLRATRLGITQPSQVPGENHTDSASTDGPLYIL